MVGSLVSICVPTIGRVEMLAETFASVRAQTYTHYEVLILDNACETPQGCDLGVRRAGAPSARYPCGRTATHVRQLLSGRHSRTRGLPHVFPRDDVYLPAFLEQHVTLLEAHGNAAFSGVQLRDHRLGRADGGDANDGPRRRVWRGGATSSRCCDSV